jgi:hypothetical protein
MVAVDDGPAVVVALAGAVCDVPLQVRCCLPVWIRVSFLSAPLLLLSPL